MRMSLESSVVLVCLLTVCLCQERDMSFLSSQLKMDDQAPVAEIEEFKRAPAMGFQGMRGKKDGLVTLADADMNFEEYKRAPAMGFQGVRGKKAPQMGFSAMRGKKDDFNHNFWEYEEEHPDSYEPRGKKAPSGFFGMRGKKVPQAFFGMRGKKGPSGFMGVRGKKDGLKNIDLLMQVIRESATRQEPMEVVGSRVRRFATPNGLSNAYMSPDYYELV